MSIQDQVRALFRAAGSIGEEMAIDMVVAAVEADMLRRQAAAAEAKTAALEEHRRMLARERQQRSRMSRVTSVTDVTERDTPQNSGSDPVLVLSSPEADPDPERAIPVPRATEPEPLADLDPFPVNGSPGPTWSMPVSLLRELAAAYPAIDVLAEARKARVWVLASPANRKTARGMPKFLTGWIGRASNGRQATLLPSARGSPGGDVRVGHVKVEAGKQYPIGVQDI